MPRVIIGGGGGSGAGTELAYGQVTAANVTVSATSEATAQDVVSSGAVTYDGTAVMIEFYAGLVATGAAAGSVFIVLQDGATVVGTLAQIVESAGTVDGPCLVRYKLTPSAGSHTYKVTAYRVTANGTIACGTGGTTNFLPSYIRVTKA